MPTPAETLTIDEAAAAFGHPASHIVAVAQGRKLKDRPTLEVPATFGIARRSWERDFEGRRMAVERRELWGGGRLLWAVEHSRPISPR